MRLTTRQSERAAHTLVETLVVMAIVGVLFSIVGPAVQRARDASLRSSCLRAFGNNELHFL